MKAGESTKAAETVNKFQIKNEDFIIDNSGISSYRTLRVFLISKKTEGLFYDIIIKKNIKLSKKEKKAEQVRILKLQLNALTSEEKNANEMKGKRDDVFKKYPFYYNEITELIVDINFKNYLQTNFNAAFTSECLEIASFLDLKNTDDLFVAEVYFKKELKEVNSKIQSIVDNKKNIFMFASLYKSIFERKELLLKLNNFGETEEFCSNLDKSELIPLIKKEKIQEIILKRYLNRNPIRNNKEQSMLPSLPLRFLINKRSAKSFLLRSHFKDQYSYPVLKSKRQDNSIDQEDNIKEEAEYQLEKQYTTKQDKKSYENNIRNFKNINSVKLLDKLERMRDLTMKCTELNTKHSPSKKSMKNSNYSQVACPIKMPKSPQNYEKFKNQKFSKFSLDSNIAKKIKQKYFPTNIESFNPIEQSQTSKISTSNSIREVVNMFNHTKSLVLRGFMNKYRYTTDSFEALIRNFCFLNKSSLFLSVYPKSGSFDRENLFSRGFVNRTLQNLKLKTSEFYEYIRTEGFTDLTIDIRIIKDFFPKLKMKHIKVYNRMLRAIGVNPKIIINISLEQFLKINYFILDGKCDKSESIDFCLKVIFISFLNKRKR